MAFASSSASASAPPTAANARTSAGDEHGQEPAREHARAPREKACARVRAGWRRRGVREGRAYEGTRPARRGVRRVRRPTGARFRSRRGFRSRARRSTYFEHVPVFSNPAPPPAARSPARPREPQSRTWKENTEGRVSERWSWGAITGQFADLDSRLGSRDPIVATRAY